jgi:hypothetical protein
MLQQIDMRPRGPQSLRNPKLRSPRLRAVVRCESNRIVIALSDGRSCSMPHELHGARDYAIAAAVRWSKRQGVDVVEIEV